MDTAIRRQTIADLLHRTARRLPGKPAILCGDTCWTFAEFDALVDRVAAGLSAMGVRTYRNIIVVAAPARDVRLRIDVGGDALRECAAEETLRTLLVEEPRQTGKQASGEIAVQQGRTRAERLEPEAIAAQRVQRTDRFRPRVRVDPVQRPVRAGATDRARQSITRRTRATDAHNACAGCGEQARNGRLTDAEVGRDRRSRLRAAQAQ